MREILFKAKRIDNGEWVEGFLFKMQMDDGYTWCIGEEPLTANDYSEIIGCGRTWFFINHHTLSQYTGLTDKNGNKIWENDIVGYYSEYSESWNYGTVSYGEFNCSCCNGVYGWTFECGDIRDYKSYEVKGNIFDHPELLKGGAE